MRSSQDSPECCESERPRVRVTPQAQTPGSPLLNQLSLRIGPWKCVIEAAALGLFCFQCYVLHVFRDFSN